jgi:putative DNA primase/helicase
MSKKRDPSARAGALGSDQEIAQQRPDHITKSHVSAPPAAGSTSGNSGDWVAPNGAASTSSEEASDQAEIARLAALPLLDYERARDSTAERLRCRVTTLDSVVAAARAPAEAAPANSGGQGRPLAILDIEPWPEAVDGAAVLDEIAATIQRYIVTDAATADAIALWIMHTHAIEAADVSPRLAITSPEKRCGKTTLLHLLSALVVRPLPTANMTAATLFRAIEAVQPTLLIDEADTFISDTDDLRGIINAGHCRATATVLRTVPSRDGWEIRQFGVWGALALAAIGKLPGTIEDRSIKVAMHRRRLDEPVERLRIDRLEQLRPLARRAARWASDHFVALSAADPGVPAELHDRAADNWCPLLAIADAAGGEWAECARRAAVALARAGVDEIEAPGIMLLSDLQELFGAEPSGVLFTTDILVALQGREDRPWAEFRRGQPITAVQMAELLKAYGIPRNNTVRRGAKTAKGYRERDFADVWSRYPSQAVTRSQVADSAAPSDPGSVTPDRDVTDKSEEIREL